LATAFMEYSTLFFTKFMFPNAGGATAADTSADEDAVQFWGELGGCLPNFDCPRLACGDNEILASTVMSLFDSPALSEGSLDGEDNGGCSIPFISGFLKGLNTTDTKDEELSAAVSMQLLDTYSTTMHKKPPIVGPFEDMIGSVCPHAWHVKENSVDEWLEALSSANTDSDNFADGCSNEIATSLNCNIISAVDRCSGNEFNIFANRFALPGPNAYQYGSAIMYMPSEFEVYTYQQWLNMYADWKSPYGGGYFQGNANTAATQLLLMKMRYRDHGAEHHAAEDINDFNNRPLSAGQCDGAPTSYDLTRGSAGQLPSDPQDPCVYMHYLLLITAACEDAAHNEKHADFAQCKLAIAAVLVAMSEACEGTCNPDILSDYFCTSIAMMSGTACEGRAILDYFMGEMQDNSCFYCADSFSSGPVGGYGSAYGGFVNMDGVNIFESTSMADFAFNYGAFNYYGATDSNCRRRLEHVNNNNNAYGSNNCGRRLSHDYSSMSVFKSMDAIDNLKVVVDWVTLDSTYNSAWSFDYFNFTNYGALGDDGPLNNKEYHEYASDMLAVVKSKLVDESLVSSSTKQHQGRVSIISTGLAEVATEDEEPSLTYRRIRDFMGEFLHKTAQLYKESSFNTYNPTGFLPIFPTCDPEFEESLIRDGFELKNAMHIKAGETRPTDGVQAGAEGPCAAGPSFVSEARYQHDRTHRYAAHKARFFWGQ